VRLAVLDVGSNTVNLLVVDAHRGAAPVPIHSERMDLRLAEHIDADGNINKRAVDGLIRIVKQASYRTRKLGCEQLDAFATSAIREAVNGKSVIATVREETGVHLTVMPGKDEAELTFLAVRRWYGWSSGTLLVADIGGGSVELAVGEGEQPTQATSVPLGAGRVYREFLHNDPPKSSQVRSLQEHVAATLGEIADDFADIDVDHVVGTSKTFRQLARLAYREFRGSGPAAENLLHIGDLERLADKLVKLELAERIALPRISESRAPQLAAGSLVALGIMRTLEVDSIEVCPWALREGIILRRIDASAQ